MITWYHCSFCQMFWEKLVGLEAPRGNSENEQSMQNKDPVYNFAL